MEQGRWDDAQALLQQTLGEARARRLLKPQALCLNALAILAHHQNDLVGHFELSRETLNLLRQAGDRRSEAVMLSNVGGGWMNLGNLAAARRDLEEGLRLNRQNGDRATECGALTKLSMLALWQDDDSRALALVCSALDTAVALQAGNDEAVAAICLGDAEAALGRLAPAAQAYAKARRVAREVGHGVQFDASAGQARLALAQGDIGGALQALRPLLSPAGANAKPDSADGSADVCEPLAADAAAGHFDSGLSPRLIELTIHRVLAAAGDPRAAAWLQCAHLAMMAQADTITDAALRQMFLANIPHHCEIVELWAAQGAVSKPANDGFAV